MIANPVYFAESNPGPGLPSWLNDADLMRREAEACARYFDNPGATADGKLGPVLGMYSHELAFRIVHRLDGQTLYNSNRSYQGPHDGEWGDKVSLGNTLNLKDGQVGAMLARILAPVATPPELAFYLVFKHTYVVLVD